MTISLSHPLTQVVILVAFIVIFYFLLLRPQQKRVQAHDQLINSLKIDGHVITAGGFLGRIIKIEDDFLLIELSPGVEVKILKSSVESLSE
jgi:preprotein translocase subunit YajC